jgi:predicted Zn-dependent protease
MRTKLLVFVFILVWMCPPSSAQEVTLKALVDTGKYAEAEATAKKLLAKTPNDAVVRHQLGEVLAIKQLLNSNAQPKTPQTKNGSKANCAAPNYSN